MRHSTSTAVILLYSRCTETGQQAKKVVSLWRLFHCWQSKIISWIHKIRKMTKCVCRTYHTRKAVAELIFKVIDADGNKAMSLTHVFGVDCPARKWLCCVRGTGRCAEKFWWESERKHKNLCMTEPCDRATCIRWAASGDDKKDWYNWERCAAVYLCMSIVRYNWNLNIDGLGEINMADFQFLLAELEQIREAQNSKL